MYLVRKSIDNILLLNEYVNPIDIVSHPICLENSNTECMIGLRNKPSFLSINKQFDLVRD